jgi:segregation and condensation protein B
VNAAQIVEAVLFASDAPLKADEIARADEALDEDQVEEALQELRSDYDEGERAFQIVELAEGYQILTRPEFSTYLERFDTVPRPSRLSGPALETLAIIAYRQPIGRIEMEYIRGVGAAGVIRTLTDRGLIDVVGRGEGLGRPLLYGTTRLFLEHFGFASLEDLPRPEELPVVLRDRIPLGPEDGEAPDPNQVPLELAGGALGVSADPSADSQDQEASDLQSSDPHPSDPQSSDHG